MISDRDSSPRAKAVYKNKIILDFILSSAHNDERPYLEVFIFEKRFLGLLDSGASCSILGKSGWDVLKNFNLPVKPANTSCLVANGERCKVVLGSIEIPIRVQDRIEIFNVLVVPEIQHSLILGADFWKITGIVPDLPSGQWVFSNNPVEHIS